MNDLAKTSVENSLKQSWVENIENPVNGSPIVDLLFLQKIEIRSVKTTESDGKCFCYSL